MSLCVWKGGFHCRLKKPFYVQAVVGLQFRTCSLSTVYAILVTFLSCTFTAIFIWLRVGQYVAVSSCIFPPVTNCTTVSLAPDVTINTSMVPLLYVQQLSIILCDLWDNTRASQPLIHRNLLAWLFQLCKTSIFTRIEICITLGQNSVYTFLLLAQLLDYDI